VVSPIKGYCIGIKITRKFDAFLSVFRYYTLPANANIQLHDKVQSENLVQSILMRVLKVIFEDL